MNSLQQALSSSHSLSLEEFYQLVENELTDNQPKMYETKYLTYIQDGKDLSDAIKKHLQIEKKFFNQIQKLSSLKFCMILEPWCLDACVLLPILEAISVIRPELEIRLYLRDSNEDLMNQFLTNGSKSIPIAFGLDENDEEIFRWGARTALAQKNMDAMLGQDFETKYKAMKEWYLSDNGKSVQEEWLDSLNS